MKTEIDQTSIKHLISKIEEFRRLHNWTHEKYTLWEKILEYIKDFETISFSGIHHTYGISRKGDYTIYHPVPQSSIYRKGLKQPCLVICVAHGSRSLRYYKAFKTREEIRNDLLNS